MPSASPFPAFRTLSVLGLVSALALTACSTEQESDPAILESSVISPDALVTCEDHGDCGEPGSVRWSIPLEGEYVMYVFDGSFGTDAAVTLPLEHAVAGEIVYPGATVHDGVLYQHEQDRVRAVDLDTTEVLWTEAVDPDRRKRVRRLHVVGDRLVMLAEDNRDWSGLLYLLEPGPDGLDWVHVDLGPDLSSDTPLANDTHVLVQDRGRGRPGDQDGLRHLVDAVTGEVEWSERLPGVIDHGTLTNDSLFTVERADEDDDGPDLIRRVDLADGRILDEFPAPEGLGTGEENVLGGTVLVASPGGDLLIGTDGVLDTATGELLWRDTDNLLAGPSGGARSREFDEDSPDLLRLHRDGRVHILRARTGEVVDQGPSDARPSAFDARSLWNSDGSDQEALDPYRTPLEARGPGVEEDLLIDVGAGADHLTSYRTDDGEYVGVYQACAPDGMRTAGWDSPSSNRGCVAPRLFAVDYGVAGSEPQ